MFVGTKNRGNIRRLGGVKAIGDRAVHFNGSTRLHSSKTPQSTSDRLGGGGIVQGTEKRLRFVVCFFRIMAGGVFIVQTVLMMLV